MLGLPSLINHLVISEPAAIWTLSPAMNDAKMFILFPLVGISHVLKIFKACVANSLLKCKSPLELNVVTFPSLYFVT